MSEHKVTQNALTINIPAIGKALEQVLISQLWLVVFFVAIISVLRSRELHPYLIGRRHHLVLFAALADPHFWALALGLSVLCGCLGAEKRRKRCQRTFGVGAL